MVLYRHTLIQEAERLFFSSVSCLWSLNVTTLWAKAIKNTIVYRAPTAKLIIVFRKFCSHHYNSAELPGKKNKKNIKLTDRIQNVLRTSNRTESMLQNNTYERFCVQTCICCNECCSSVCSSHVTPPVSTNCPIGMGLEKTARSILGQYESFYTRFTHKMPEWISTDLTYLLHYHQYTSMHMTNW